ncbi:hypothetical protein [Thioalkalivibrio paradoxus]|uniref:hypothetical protein n=1 Tax=Thioalkalivibrio paradoxus TaxID=108010 RepID=UPI00022C31FE
MTVSVKVTACLVSLATRRAEERSVIRHRAPAVPRRRRHPGRWMADDGLRPFPPYASAGACLGGYYVPLT